MPQLLVLRPEPGASATAEKARALGLEPIVAPLFAVRPLAPDAAALADPPQALLLTSANAARALGAWAAPFAHLPVYAVGEATAAAARAAGFGTIVAGAGDAAAIVARAATDGVRRLLHLAGREHRAVAHPGVEIARAIVYASDEAPDLPAPARAAIAGGCVALIHSPRAGARFAALVDNRAAVALAAISAPAAEAAGEGWRAVAVASIPSDTALLAAAARLCETAR